MKLGSISVSTPDGDEPRLVAIESEAQRAIDLRAAERIRLQRLGATPAAALRLAEAVFPSSMAMAIAEGPSFLKAARVAAGDPDSSALVPLPDVRWLPSIDAPMIRDCMAFEEHLLHAVERIGQSVNPLHYELPAYYKANVSALLGHEQTVPWPAYTRFMDYELELGFVIGRTGRNLTPNEAGAYLFGVTIFDDFSARDIQAREMTLTLGPTKGKDFGTAVGPWITTADEVDMTDLTMIARVNGEEWSRGNSGAMMWTPAELIAYISYGETLRPGDLIASGTVGNGCGLEMGRRLQPGDVVELEVSGIGVLRNRLGEPETTGWNPTPRRARAHV